jgi:hypothetical protein
MSSSKTLTSLENQFKIKICLIGGYENYKNQFQKFVSSHKLPFDNKTSIGVNISKIDFNYNSNSFGFYLWNIDCDQRYSFLRTTYYHGAEAIIVFISESKLEQIRSYLDEIKLRLPIITIIFCIILEKSNKNDIIEKYFKKKNFDSLIKSNNIRIRKLSTPSELFELICSFYVEKRENCKENDNFMISFIPVESFIRQKDIKDECNNYYEPINTIDINQNCRINTDLILEYLSELGFQFEDDPLDYLKIKNENFGTFSISLKSGKVKLLPIICQKCRKKKCNKFDKEFYVCIEQKTKGWTTDNGLSQAELLLLSKILALESGKLPLSVLKQIAKINTCIRNQ